MLCPVHYNRSSWLYQELNTPLLPDIIVEFHSVMHQQK